MLGWTPRVKGGSPGRPRSRSGSKPDRFEIVGTVEVGRIVAARVEAGLGARALFARSRFAPTVTTFTVGAQAGILWILAHRAMS